MRCKYIGESRCKNKATDKYQGVAVCVEHKNYLEERVNTVLGGKVAAQSSVQADGKRCPKCGAIGGHYLGCITYTAMHREERKP